MSDINDKFFNLIFKDNEEKLENIDIQSEKGRQNLLLINNKLSEENLEFVNKIDSNIKNIEKTVENKLSEIQYKLLRVVEKVRGAVLAERGTSGAIFTTQIPINKQQITNNTTTKIKDGIAFGVPQDSEEYSSDLSLLSLKNLEFENLYVNSLNKYSTDALENFSIQTKTQTSIPIEFKINLNGVIRTASSLVIDMHSHSIAEVYHNGELFSEKKLIKTIIIPVDIKTSSVGLRIYPSIHRTNEVIFNKIGYTELIYNSPTYFETKNIQINKDLSQIVIDTCDNSNDPNINLNYYISINDEEFESFSPVAKHTAIEKQSIITTDKSQILKMFKNKLIKYSEGDYRVYVPDALQNNSVFKHDVFLPNTLEIKNRQLFLIINSEITLIKQALSDLKDFHLFINGKEVYTDEFKLYRGISSILLLDKYNENININLDYLTKLIGKENIFLERYTKDLFKDSTNNSLYITLNNLEFRDSFDQLGYVYFPGVKPKRQIDTIKIKAELKSLDQKTVPFISRILVRGI